MGQGARGQGDQGGGDGKRSHRATLWTYLDARTFFARCGRPVSPLVPDFAAVNAGPMSDVGAEPPATTDCPAAHAGASAIVCPTSASRRCSTGSRPPRSRCRQAADHPRSDPRRPHARARPGRRAAQIAYVDTPGVQDGNGPLRRYMRDAALAAAADCRRRAAAHRRDRPPRPDARSPRRARCARAARGAARATPIVIALNKIDRVASPSCCR